jgi:hypothetical protein
MKLEINEAPTDRAIRIALVTGIVGFCPLYAILRVRMKSAAR